MTPRTPRVTQCQKPSGWLGRFVLRNMNSRHSKLTDWGLSHISIDPKAVILDVGCGGGRTIGKLAAVATLGKVYGVDFSGESVAFAAKTNQQWIDMGRVEIREGSVSKLPFPENMFDIVTAVETHFWWPDLPGDVREILRVLKPGGTFILIAEVYKGATSRTSRMSEKYAALTGMKILSIDEHRQLLAGAGCSDIQVFHDAEKGWICALGRKRA